MTVQNPHLDKYQDFVAKLQEEAKLQSRLSQTRLLPSQLDALTSFIGHFSWQTAFILSGITAVVLEVI